MKSPIKFGINWKTTDSIGVKNVKVQSLDDRGRTPLHWAAGNSKNKEVIKTLLSNGADIAAKDNHGWTPLHKAAKKNLSAQIIHTLLKAGASVNDKGGTVKFTPLLTALIYDNEPEIIETLIKSGADVNVKDAGNYSPIHYAVRNSTMDNLRLLIRYGANVNAKGFYSYGITPLHKAAGANNSSAIEILLEAGAVPSACFLDGCSPIFYAISNKKRGNVRLLLKACKDAINQPNKKGNTLFHWAAQHGDVRMINMLMEAGAEINALGEHGTNALHIASAFNPYLVPYLQDIGVNTNVKDFWGRTPSHYLSRKSSTKRNVGRFIGGGYTPKRFNRKNRTCAIAPNSKAENTGHVLVK